MTVFYSTFLSGESTEGGERTHELSFPLSELADFAAKIPECWRHTARLTVSISWNVETAQIDLDFTGTADGPDRIGPYERCDHQQRGPDRYNPMPVPAAPIT